MRILILNKQMRKATLIQVGRCIQGIQTVANQWQWVMVEAVYIGHTGSAAHVLHLRSPSLICLAPTRGGFIMTISEQIINGLLSGTLDQVYPRRYFGYFLPILPYDQYIL